ncbi:MAG: D-inositol-3-phosphate glycosyltransferase, partial [Egibacteraceae bacterium]
GTLVDSRQPRDYAAALLPYLADPAHRAAVGRAARRSAEQHGWERTTAATLDVYRSVLGGRLQRAAPLSQRGA